MRWVAVAFSLFMILFGAVFIATSHAHRADSRPYPGGVTTTATLSEVTVGKDDSNVSWYQGVYTFTGPDGARFTLPENTTAQAESQVAQEVKVTYRNADPATARIIPERDHGGLIFYVVGGAIVIAGCYRLVGALLPDRTAS